MQLLILMAPLLTLYYQTIYPYRRRRWRRVAAVAALTAAAVVVVVVLLGGEGSNKGKGTY